MTYLRSVMVLLSLGIFSSCPLSIRAAQPYAPSPAPPPSPPAFDNDLRLTLSADLGTAVYGLVIPAFFDSNGILQGPYTAGSSDFLFQAGLERLLGQFMLQTMPVEWGLRGKLGLAYTNWSSQPAGGSPGGYSPGNGYRLGDAFNLHGFWWAFSPELTAHLPLDTEFELGLALGVSMFGYAGMVLQDPSTGFSTGIANLPNSAYVQNRFSALSAAPDWSVAMFFRPPQCAQRYFFEAGMTGPIWNLGLGVEFRIPLDKNERLLNCMP